MADHVERRRTRSQFRGEAADLYLDALSRRHGLRAAVLADEQGLPIAAAGADVARDTLSAYGALYSATRPVSAYGSLRSVPLRLGEHVVSLTFLGQEELPGDVADDLRRILDLH